MRGLTQYQLKFPGPFSTDFKDSRSDTSYNGLRLTRTCRARGHYTRDWAGNSPRETASGDGEDR